MKTRFTKYTRYKWWMYVPLLFLCTLFGFRGYAADCGVEDFTIIIDCEGAMTISVNSSTTIDSYSFQADGSITVFTESPIVHATKIFDSEGDFTLEVFCASGSNQITGTLPEFDDDGLGGGTYTYDADGDLVSGPTNVSTGGSLAMSSSKNNPTCASGQPNDMDGSITITVDGNVTDKCSGAEIEVTLTGPNVPMPATKTVTVGNSVTFEGLGEGSFSASAVITNTGCPCTLGTILDIGPIILTGPTVGTTSLACNSLVNISVSQSCSATIMASDILRGVTDPCDPMLAMIDSLVVKLGGTFLGGSGSGALGLFIPDVHDVPGVGSIVGQPLTIEVIDEESGNLCWGNVLLEDKSPPLVTCNDPALMEILCLDYDGNVMSTIDDLVIDCSPFTTTIIAQSELEDCDDIDDQVLRRVVVTYFATDINGFRSENCTDTLDVIRFDTIPGNDTLDVPGCIAMPPDFVLDPSDMTTTVEVEGNVIKWPVDSMPLSCTGDYVMIDGTLAPAPIDLDEGGSGFPRLIFTNEDGDIDTSILFPLNYREASDFYKRIIDDNLANCNIAVDFEDAIFDFGCKTKVQRQWYLREWSCEGEQVLPLGLQEIIITDTEDPFFVETVPDMEFTVNADQCSRFLNIPKPVVDDNCDDDEVEIEIAIYDVDEDDNWVLIGPTTLPNGLQSMDFDFPTGMSWIVYTAFDDCGNSASDTTKITVVDDTPPVVICKEFLVIGISGDDNVSLPATSIDNGTYDQCELESICAVRMDDLDLLMSLDANGDGEVRFSDFDEALQNAATDGNGCYRNYSQYTFDINGVAYISKATICTPYIEFCCSDAGIDSVMVEFRAFDADGNSNRCMTFVELQDKNPAIITCPRNITIDCDFNLPDFDAQYDNVADDPLSDFFGSIVQQGNQKAFGVPDEFILSDIDLDYVDGTIFDNCTIPRISVRITSNIDNCGFGTIRRRFFSHETGRAVRVCQQTITVIRGELIEGVDIIYPTPDTTLLGCMTPEEVLEESFGSPEVIGDDCSLIGISEENQLFLFNTQDEQSDACFKIVRTFTIIDWCQSTGGGQPTIIGEPFRQVIKVNDPDGPTITCSDDLVVEIIDCEEGEVMLMASASDECTEGEDHIWSGRVELDLDGNGVPETFNEDIIIIVDPTGRTTSKATHTASYPLGKHRITWTVSDRCGNSTSCVQYFEIVNRKKPTPFAVDISTVLMTTNGMVEVWASDLSSGPSERPPCPGQVLQRSIVRVSDVGNRTDGGFGISEPALSFTCADVGEEGVPVNYFLFYETGGDTIFDFTTVDIRVQDNNGVCDNVTMSFITGNVKSALLENIPNVEVAIKAGLAQEATVLDEALTNVSGNYAFPAMPQGGSYVVDPFSDDDYLNGVSTLDLVLIQKHILGLQTLDTPYDIIAADINNDRVISSLDLVELRRLILGFTDSFEGNDSWRFIDEAYTFQNEENPLLEAFDEVYYINNLSADMSIDFTGMKVGDVNGSVSAASVLASNRSVYNIVVSDQQFSRGEIIEVDFTASEMMSSLGLQMGISFDSDELSFVGIEAGILDIGTEHLGTGNVKDGELLISWNDVYAQNINTDDVLLTLIFEAKTNGAVQESLRLLNAHSTIASEIYDRNHDIENLAFIFDNDAQISQGFVLQQNTPNPFAENTLIGFYLPKNADASLIISDMTGRIIRNYTGSFDKGQNYITVNRSDLPQSGVLYYTLETDEFTDTKRMVVLK